MVPPSACVSIEQNTILLNVIRSLDRNIAYAALSGAPHIVSFIGETIEVHPGRRCR